MQSHDSWWIVALPLGLALIPFFPASIVPAILRFFSKGPYRLLSILLCGALIMLSVSVACYSYLKTTHESYAAFYFALACFSLNSYAATRYAYEVRKGTWQKMWLDVFTQMQKAAAIHQMSPISAEEFRMRVRVARRSLIPLSFAALIVLSLPFLLLSSAPLRTRIGITEEMAGLSALISLIAIPVFFLVAIRNVFWRCGLFCPRCGPRRVHSNFINYVSRHGRCPKCKFRILALPELGSANPHN